MINVSILYGIYPALNKTEKFYRKRGYVNVVLEYGFVKKFLFVTIPLVIIFNIFSDFNPFLDLIFSENSYEATEAYPPNFSRNLHFGFLWMGIKIILTYVTIAALIRIITQIAKKDYRFYFAKAYCQIISEKRNNFEKIEYLFPLINSYNKYLQRNLKVEINNIKKIYSIILYKDINQQWEIIKSICTTLDGDRLKLAQYLSSLLKIPDSDFYIKKSLFQHLKIIGAFLAAAIPIIISIIQLIIEINKPP